VNQLNLLDCAKLLELPLELRFGCIVVDPSNEQGLVRIAGRVLDLLRVPFLQALFESLVTLEDPRLLDAFLFLLLGFASRHRGRVLIIALF
jgi:hypothetical protein